VNDLEARKRKKRKEKRSREVRYRPEDKIKDSGRCYCYCCKSVTNSVLFYYWRRGRRNGLQDSALYYEAQVLFIDGSTVKYIGQMCLVGSSCCEQGGEGEDVLHGVTGCGRGEHGHLL
jgi:hypothetical protein